MFIREYQYVISYVAPFVTIPISLYAALCIEGVFFTQIIGTTIDYVMALQSKTYTVS